MVRNLLNLHVPLPSLETCPAPARIPESVNECSSGLQRRLQVPCIAKGKESATLSNKSKSTLIESTTAAIGVGSLLLIEPCLLRSVLTNSFLHGQQQIVHVSCAKARVPKQEWSKEHTETTPLPSSAVSNATGNNMTLI